MKGSFFISYRRAGNENALAQIERVLVDAFGQQHVFLDKESLRAGDKWAAHIHEAVRTAPAVLVLYSAAWRGVRPDGTARIDDPDDWVRKELVMAHQHRRPLLPVIIDDAPPPNASDLPPDLRFLTAAQFMKLDPRQPEAVVSALRRLIYGRRWWGRFFAQATWIAAGIAGLVLATYGLFAGGVLDNAFARGAAALREQLGWQSDQGEIAVVEINDAEFREVFGSRQPLDAEVLAIGVDALHKASRRIDACADDRPVAITLDLHSGMHDGDERGQQALQKALGSLAACRPVVLPCPQQVMVGAAADAEAWMSDLRRAAGTGRIVFGSTQIDPEGLRRRQYPTELALLAAGLARQRGADAFQEWPCSCPIGRAAATACENMANGWHPRAVAVRLNHDGDWSFSTGLANMDHVARHRVVMLGANFGAQRPSMDTRHERRMRVAPSATALQSDILHGALHHAPRPFQPAMLLLLLGYAWLIATATLLGGALLDRSSGRLDGRVKAYVLMAATALASIFVPWLMAARVPSLTWFAMPLFAIGALSLGRAMLANFELVLRGQPGWQPPRTLLDDLFTSPHKGSAVTRLTVFWLEALTLVVTWTLAVIFSTEYARG